MSDWLENLKVGDEVIVDVASGLYGNNYVATVVRRTKTLIFVTHRDSKGERKFKSNGSTGDYGSPHLREPTDERRERIVHAQYVSHLSRFEGWKDLSLDVLRKIYLLTKKD